MYRDCTIPWELCDEQRRADLRAAWAGGELTYKLDDSQLEVHRQIDDVFAAARTAAERDFLLDIGRRWGKSTVMMCRGASTCLRERRPVRIPYGAATAKMVREILNPLMEWFVSDAPPDLRPVWRSSEMAWIFPANGARIRMVGLDLRPNDMRGVGTVGVLLDELAFADKQRYVLRSIVDQMMLTEPEAWLLMGSTPADTPGTYWTTHLVPEYRAAGRYAHRTIEDNPRLTEEQREAFIAKAGGRTSTTCRREYFAEHVIEESRAVCPEWQAVKAQRIGAWDHGSGEVVDPVGIHDEERLRPDFFDAYAGTDQGHVDLWAWLFGYYDFVRQKLVIEDEVVVRRSTSTAVVARVQGTERRLGYRKTRRYGDMPAQMAADLTNDHGLTVQITAKDDARAAIAAARRWIQEGRVIIHPRCRYLLAQLDFGIWKTSGLDYERGDESDPDDLLGHLDAWQALVYLIRNVNERRNPYPAHRGKTLATHYIPDEPTTDRQRAVLAIAGRKRIT